MKKRWVVGLEEVFILFLILLSFIEFFGLLPADMDFLKKITSWTILGVLLYHASITKIFFGDKHDIVDLGLIGAFFLMLLKDLVLVASSLVHEGGLYSEFYKIVFQNSWLIERSGFVLGTLLVLGISVYLTYNLHVRKPSILHVLHDAGLPKTFRKRVERFLLVFLVLNAFFILIFNLIMEWLAIIVDYTLVLITALVFFFVFAKKHSRKHDFTWLIFHIGNHAEKFYKKFMQLFHNKKRIYLGFSGILVLHLLTDVSVYLVPYIFSFQEVIYFGGLPGLPLLSLLKQETAELILFEMLPIVLIYLFNLIAILLLMFSPAYLWWKVYKKKGFKISHTELSIFFSSVLVLILAPVFAIKTIQTNGLIGVTILSQAMQNLTEPLIIVLLSIFLFLTIFAMSYSHKIKEGLLILMLVGILGFFSFYIYQYFKSNYLYYISSIGYLWKGGYYYLSANFALFFVIISLAYLGGWLIFLKEVKKEYKYIR